MKKIIAPLIVVLVMGFLITAYILSILYYVPSLLIQIIMGIILVFVLAVLVYVLVQRIKEIKKEDDDDFSKY